jgi:cytoskeleton protein RodZ
MNDILTSHLDEIEGMTRGPGPLLREARNARQLDQSDVARRLNLDLWVVAALESDDHAKLPPPIFVRGYLRSFARLVDVPVEQVLAEYDRVHRPAPVPERPRRPQPQPVEAEESLIGRVGLAAAAVAVVAVAVALGWWFMGPQPDAEPAASAPARTATELGEAPPAEPVTPKAEDQTTETGLTAEVESPVEAAASLEPSPVGGVWSAPAAQGPADESPLPAPVVGSESDPGEAAIALTGAETGTQPRAEAEAQAQGTAEASQPEPTAASSPAKDVLVFRYQEDCWTAVQDADGERLAYDVIKAGEQVTLRGRAPFRVTLGNAPGVELQFNGEPFDHLRYSRGRIARFEVGGSS